MFNFSKSGQTAGVMRLQLEAPPAPLPQAPVEAVGDSGDTLKLPQVETNPGPSPRMGASTGADSGLPTRCVVAGLAGLAIGAFALRFIPNNNHTAYIDEASQILAGRYLIEKGQIYAYILQWSYGSYLWPLVAGSMDILGGLMMVRAFTAFCGVIMTLATALAAFRLSPPTLPVRQRQIAAFGAGLIMAVLSTGLGLGAFGTYDGLAGAGFMLGVALLFPVEGRARRLRLVGGVLLLFIAFLSKYIIAFYFPVLCVYLLFSAGSVRNAVSRFIWFVAPLALLCAGYFVIFRADLLTLISLSHNYTDLKTDDPFLVYVWEQPEIWVMAIAATFGWGYATRLNKVVALGGAAIILAFQLISRPDYDFWKHSIYLTFFLAPLASLAVFTLLARLYRLNRQNTALTTGRRNFRLVTGSASVAGVIGILAILSLSQANLLVNFYPNVSAAIPAIKQETATARTVLTDDLSLRYYLYPQLPAEQVTDPFSFDYRGKSGLDAYKAGVTDRYFDTIILDGGIGPVAQQVNATLIPLVKQYYRPVSSVDGPNGSHVDIYKPQACVISTPADGSRVYDFGGDTQGWGGRSSQGQFQAGSQVALSQEQSCNGHSSLKFQPTSATPQVAVPLGHSVKTIKAQVYLETTPGFSGSSVVGMAAFDQNWQWHDDGFKQSIRSGRWVEMTWQLPASASYNEFDLVFPKEVTAVYISQVEVDP